MKQKAQVSKTTRSWVLAIGLPMFVISDLMLS
jgi:hypothetical protein